MTASSRKISRAPIMPDRVRRIGTRGFAFVPHPFLRDGFYASLTPDETALYLLLVLVGDRNGLSFYHFDSLCSLLQMPLERYLLARNGLIEKGLVACDGTRFQVLELPERPVVRTAAPLVTAEDFEHDPATVRAQIRRSLHLDRDDE